jgi:mannose-6-phosphate isomerase-like protein (cupin superfamily)
MATAQPHLEAKSATAPDEVRPFADKGHVDVVHLAGGDVGMATFEPGWTWAGCVKPIAGTESCQVHHVGYDVSGRMRIVMNDGAELEIRPGDFFEIPPGHTAEVLGDEPCVQLGFEGITEYAKRH